MDEPERLNNIPDTKANDEACYGEIYNLLCSAELLDRSFHTAKTSGDRLYRQADTYSPVMMELPMATDKHRNETAKVMYLRRKDR